MEEIMAAGIGDKLNLVGFFLTLVGILASFFGAVLMYAGSSISGDSVWQTLKKIQGVAEQASIVASEQWTPVVEVDVSSFVPPTAHFVDLAFKMHSADTRIPLQMMVSTKTSGGLVGRASGELGTISMMIDGKLLYVSVSHPDITWSLAVSGYGLER